ncbi:hypothetical protein BE21_23765 [Sorangium cellulosum]|uniref:Uncharacterized protein n=1 Tax=Sorangium cellulosum TaxID=56 RepID=A0A150TV33_SORCE|nr:hypothetical protein BE21_23765 [Sorangium cellulosum]
MLMVGLALVACGDDGEEGTSGPGGTSSTSGTGGDGGNGGTDGTGGNGGETGGDLDDKQLGDLTDEESQAVCDAVAASAADITKEDGCELVGLIAAATPDSGLDCETAKEQCINEPDEPAEEEFCTAEDFAGCAATVAEFKACTDSQFEMIKALTCESDLESFKLPPECEAVDEKCPELFGSDTGGEEP